VITASGKDVVLLVANDLRLQGGVGCVWSNRVLTARYARSILVTIRGSPDRADALDAQRVAIAYGKPLLTHAAGTRNMLWTRLRAMPFS
jgi:hypothetical protein